MKINILTICGSLRDGSSNAKLIEAYSETAPSELAFSSLETIAKLPIYNPDLDKEPLPAAVIETRHRVKEADLLLFSTPEYIHSLPAAMKNLLEWLVSDPAFYGKKAFIIHANSSSRFALSQLREVLSTMSAEIVEPASIVVNLGSNKVTVDQIISDDEISVELLRSSKFLAQEYNKPNQAAHTTPAIAPR